MHVKRYRSSLPDVDRKRHTESMGKKKATRESRHIPLSRT
jgi:hypothetical protein